MVLIKIVGMTTTMIVIVKIVVVSPFTVGISNDDVFDVCMAMDIFFWVSKVHSDDLVYSSSRLSHHHFRHAYNSNVYRICKSHFRSNFCTF